MLPSKMPTPFSFLRNPAVASQCAGTLFGVKQVIIAPGCRALRGDEDAVSICENGAPGIALLILRLAFRLYSVLLSKL